MKRILFVCTGNTCRSPMAEYYFNRLLDLAHCEEFRAESAGIFAFPGSDMSPSALQVLRQQGIDASNFRSRRFSGYMAAGCYLIVAMGFEHAAMIKSICPEASDKVRLLMQYADGDEVPDPFGGGVENYQEIFDYMVPALQSLARSLRS